MTMDDQLAKETPKLDPDTTALALIERHLSDWLQLQDYLRDAHAPTDQLRYCCKQVTRLQLELYQLRNS